MGVTEQDIAWMQDAIKEAKKAATIDEVPVGAIVVLNNQIIGCGYNQPIKSSDPTSHAEINALRMAAQAVNNYRINNATMYVTLEPCAMCAGAIIQARLKRVVFGAYDLRAGAGGTIFNVLDNNMLNHRVEITPSCCEIECSNMIREFFRVRR